MSKSTVIIDYGVGNLRSVARALEYCGCNPVLSDDIEIVMNADRLVLPGVGAFGSCMAALAQRGLVEPLTAFMHSGRPLLGICVGMQMLMKGSDEFGEHAGLGLIPGWVRAIPETTADGRSHKIPHIGWNTLFPPLAESWRGSLFEGIAVGSACYFVHTFAAVPIHQENVLATCDYNGRLICAAIRQGNVYGVQFHPEKSGPIGLKILSTFLNGSVRDYRAGERTSGDDT